MTGGAYWKEVIIARDKPDRHLLEPEDCDCLFNHIMSCDTFTCLLFRWGLSTALNFTQCNDTDALVKNLMIGKN